MCGKGTDFIRIWAPSKPRTSGGHSLHDGQGIACGPWGVAGYTLLHAQRRRAFPATVGSIPDHHLPRRTTCRARPWRLRHPKYRRLHATAATTAQHSRKTHTALHPPSRAFHGLLFCLRHCYISPVRTPVITMRMVDCAFRLLCTPGDRAQVPAALRVVILTSAMYTYRAAVLHVWKQNVLPWYLV